MVKADTGEVENQTQRSSSIPEAVGSKLAALAGKEIQKKFWQRNIRNQAIYCIDKERRSMKIRIKIYLFYIYRAQGVRAALYNQQVIVGGGGRNKVERCTSSENLGTLLKFSTGLHIMHGS